jgi:hypothetical protein
VERLYWALHNRKDRKMNDSEEELIEEAKDAFYKWEGDTDRGLSDNERIIWMQGYMCAKQAERIEKCIS